MPVSVLINPSHVKFVSSCSVLPQVSPAHCPRKVQFIWGMTPILMWKNKSYCCDLQQVLRGKEKAKSPQVVPWYAPVTHISNIFQWKSISKKLLKCTPYSMAKQACQVCWHAGLAQSLLSRHNPKHPTPKKVVQQVPKGARETIHCTSKTAAAAAQPEQFPFIFPLGNLL